MPAKSQHRVLLIHGGDEYGVKLRARDVFRAWCAEIGGTDHETIDAGAANAAEALRALNRLREALETLPFFGPGKVVWFRDCTFLGDERTASAAAVTERLAALVPFLQGFPWGSVRLLVTAGKVDRTPVVLQSLRKDWRSGALRGAVARERGLGGAHVRNRGAGAGGVGQGDGPGDVVEFRRDGRA